MPFRIGFLLYPHLTQLDLTGPAQVLAAMSDSALHFVWKSLEPVPSDAGISLLPSDTLQSCPDLDMLLVPGGPGQQALMRDGAVLAWLQRQGAQASWVTSVCSGSLLLGAAGLLKGYSAACHWAYRDYLPAFGARIDERRVVVDRNRITGGGVTSGIDLALWLVALVRGEEEAKAIQLQLEYAPQPPFNCGRPELAGAALTAQARQRLAADLKRLNGV
ncbi:DJ-1/PfpI family protein [Pseudomonas benzenivorans]|uniref:DJ-1/PfpI family protein n=1 Tax=Pseudomonas benzenivorans TaxID=556533 RepID=A0ABY5H4C7_9PSED|nr:DJ-1/PfpI family protein [Pseudomonas benzenivorans]UTW06869.1 DJ-1/PfpI family protein [Pseudomonas benzenivorans]